MLEKGLRRVKGVSLEKGIFTRDMFGKIVRVDRR